LICRESNLEESLFKSSKQLALEISNGSDGEQTMSSWDLVYRLVKKIPRGRVTSYGALAKALRLRGGARAAGHAMAACPSGKGIPWHRVIGAGGRLLIREPNSSLQRRLLETEGIAIDGKRVNMKKHGWLAPKTRLKSKTSAAQRLRKRRTTRHPKPRPRER
jgi:methylated-DNA-protein-cysteine methyltransferase-like protein